MKRSNRSRVIAAAAATVVLSGVSTVHQAQASVYSWSATAGTNVLNTAANWLPAVVPTINDDAFFGPSAQTSLSLTGGDNFFSMNFNADAPAYVIGDPGTTNQITLGTTANPATGGNIVNNSAFTLTYDAPVAFRTGTITAAGADIVFNGGTFNVGNNSNNNAGRNVTIAGSHNVIINSQLTGTPAITTTTPNDGSTNFGQLIMNGTGTLFLTNNANNSLFTGRIVVNSGAVQASVPNAFGANGTFLSGATVVTLGTTHVSGGTNTGRVELVGGNSFAPETLVLEGRGVTDTQLLNVSGNNTWTGPVSMATGGGSYAIQSDSGTLTISGNVTNITAGAGIRTLALRGASNGVISGNILEGTGSSNLSPFKDGTGTWYFTGSNSYTGVTTVNQGTLQIGNGGTSGSLGSGSVSLSGGNLVFNRTDSTSITNPISGTGNVVVQSGTVAFATGNVTGPAFTVNDGVAITLNSTGPTATMNVSNLTVGSTTGSTLNFSLGTGGNPTAPVITAGGLTRNGNNVVNLQGSNFSIGTITLIQNTGTEGGTGAFSLGTLPNRILATLFDTGSKVDLNITGIDFPKWTGAANNTWDTSINSPPKDWVLNSNGTTPTDYIEGDSVLFDDSSSVNTVNISNNVTPNAVTVNNSSKDYTFTGSGGITGEATLTKTGTGTLTLANDGDNTFTGTISIGAGGTLAIGAGATNGDIGSGTIVNNGNLVMNRQGGLALPNKITGSGNLVVRANSVGTLSGNNTYDGATTVETGAVLAVNSATALGSAVGNTTVQSGASLYVGAGGTFTYAEPLTVSGTGTGVSPGAIHLTGVGVTSTFGGAVTLAAPTTIVAETSSAGVFNAPITGPGSDLTFDGGGAIALAGDGSNYNNTIISNGTLQLGNGGTTGSIGTGTVSVASTATFAISRSDAYTFATVIGGDGAVASNGNGTLMLTGPNTFTGPVTMTRGVLRLTPADLQGLGSGNKIVSALNRNAGIELAGNVTIPSSITFNISNDGDLTQAGATVPFAIHSGTGETNTINSEIDLKIGGGNALLKVDAGGTLVVNGNISIVPGQGNRSISLGGAGTGIVTGTISDSPSLEVMGIQILGAGAPNWTLTAANQCSGNVSLQSGTLTLMNNQALGLTAGTFCFIGNGGTAFGNIGAGVNIGTDSITVANNLWSNRDGAGSLQTATAETNERFIGYSGATGTGTFSGQVQINGGAQFKATPAGTLVMSGVLQNGTETFANGGRNDVYVQSAGTVVFAGNNTYTGFTEMDSGTLVLTNSNAQNLIITGAGANARVRVVPIFAAGGMVFDYGTAGVADPLPTIRPLLQTALASNFVTGQFRVGNATPGIGIGYIDDTAGQKLQLLRTYLGDANVDGTVNALDFNALATNFGTNAGSAVWTQGDFNYDGNVDTSDFMMLANDFGSTLAAPPAPPVLGTLVPEPTTLVILPAGALLVLCKRARRSPVR